VVVKLRLMIREVSEREMVSFNHLAAHPMQSWEWGKFREKTGVSVLRLGRYEKRKLIETAQVTLHKIPKLPFKIGYWPKGVIPSKEIAEAVKRELRNHKVIMVKLEPNVIKDQNTEIKIKRLTKQFGLVKGRPLFTRWSFWLDLSKSEDELLAGIGE